MSIKLHEFPPCVDYSELIDIIEKKHNINVRDYAGKFSKEQFEKRQFLHYKWMEENGYGDWKHVLNVPDSDANPREDWPKDSEEMKMRIEINNKYRDIEKTLYEEVPYLDYWHGICDDINRGGVNYLFIHEDDEPWDEDLELPEQWQNWRREINAMIREEVKDSPAYDAEEGILTFHVDW